jgi:hypothetical protein
MNLEFFILPCSFEMCLIADRHYAEKAREMHFLTAGREGS